VIAETAQLAGRNMARMKLTKRNFSQMPIGHYLASNTFSHFPQPTFAETIDGTEDQWQRIVAAGVGGRLCMVFPTLDDFQRWLEERKAGA
jgi:hypothetical protein